MAEVSVPDPNLVRDAPKVLLHDHLDGGLRVQTLLELADQAGYKGLPARTPEALERAIQREAQGSDLAGYLRTFRHVIEVLQTHEALSRVAREYVDDLADDGVVYAEVRFAPEEHTSQGLSIDGAIEAVLAGFEYGTERGIEVGLICTALRHQPNSLAVATAAARWADRDVVGFDIAGPEVGCPLGDHADAIRYATEHGLGLTLHAGEGAGPDSITEALDLGAKRIGHGVRIIEDVDPTVDPPRFGQIAQRIIDTDVVLEICPTSNVHTGVVQSIRAHPVNTLLDLGLKVTINTDNRLMSGVSLTSELVAIVESHGWGWKEIEAVTLNAIDAGFGEETRRRDIRGSRIEPWYRAR